GPLHEVGPGCDFHLVFESLGDLSTDQACPHDVESGRGAQSGPGRDSLATVVHEKPGAGGDSMLAARPTDALARELIFASLLHGAVDVPSDGGIQGCAAERLGERSAIGPGSGKIHPQGCTTRSFHTILFIVQGHRPFSLLLIIKYNIRIVNTANNFCYLLFNLLYLY
ncbi:MAG: hypothetical protein CEN91_233, partial [Candidatus Berkelbacteria bacterium Licking1014_85]